METQTYDEMFAMEERHWWFRARRCIVLNLLERCVRPRDGHRPRLADLGCGCGANLAAYCHEYDAWGTPLQETQSGASNRFRYQSNWITLPDSDGTLLLSPTRIYRARMGRLLQREPPAHGRASTLTYARASLGWDVHSVLSAHRGAVTPGQELTAEVVSMQESVNLYVYAKNEPSVRIDADGRWDTRVHEVRTVVWAYEMRIQMPCARRLGQAAESVDYGDSCPRPWGDLSWHFDVNFYSWLRCTPNNPGARRRHWLEQLDRAEEIGCCTWEDMMEALWEFGRGIHPRQDTFSHQRSGGPHARDGLGHRAQTPGNHIGRKKCGAQINKKNKYRPDDYAQFNVDVVGSTRISTRSAFRLLLAFCPEARECAQS